MMRRIKAYQQLEHSDCGITCIRIVARYYGKTVPLKMLRELCDAGRMGISLRDIMACTRKLGFHSEAVKIHLADVEQMPLPAVLYWEQRHYVVLYRMSRDRQTFYIADPARGKVRLRREEFMRHWQAHDGSGLAIVMDPTPAFYEKSYPKDTRCGTGLWQMLKAVVNGNRPAFAGVMLLAGLGMVADVATPVLFQRTVDDGISGKDIALVWMLVLGQFAVFLGNYVSGSLADLLLTRLGLRMGMRMMGDYLRKLISLPVSFFDRKVSADLIQKLDDQNRIKNFLLNMPETIFFTTVNLVVFSALLIYYSRVVFAIFLMATVLSFAWTRLHLRRRKAIDYSYFSYSAENRNNVYELVNGMQEIKVNNAQQARVAVWGKVQHKINRLSMRSAYLNLSIESGNQFLSRMKDIAMTGVCATMVIKGGMTMGEMMTIGYIAGRLSGAFSNIVAMPGTLQDASMSYERLDEVLGAPAEPARTAVDDGTGREDISLEGVSFKYPGSYSPYVIDDFSAVIEHGKTTAVVGASGCGKTTLIKLLLGFYAPQKGRIQVGGTRLADADADSWLRQCGVVMQNGYIFSGTILQNIAVAEQEPCLEKAREAARVACIDDFFASLPMGYHTKLGVAGLELSGGQRQRLFIARAVYKNPAVLFLDEATSSLDAGNEASIVANLARYNAGRTVVVAAHRLSTVRHADKIVFMEHGRIAEQGTHDELVARKGAYYKLVKEQLKM